MKKILAMVLAMMLVLSMSTAFAAVDTTNWKSDKATYSAILKNYEVNGETTTGLFPVENLVFVPVADPTNPDTTNLTIAALDTTTAGDQTLTITVPSYTKVGTYLYTITETADDAQGVTYSNDTLGITVLVEYDYDNSKLKATVGLTKGEEGKDEDFTNTYDVGNLEVSKKVTGNLGDKNKVFNVTVTFKTEKDKYVRSDINYTDDGTAKAIPKNWTGTKSVVITLKDGETVKFTDIPEGVKYTVVEDDYTTGPKNGENGYDAASYKDEDATATIASGKTDAVEITNHKDTSVDTGISLDNAPYMILMALVVVAGAALIVKRASANR